MLSRLKSALSTPSTPVADPNRAPPLAPTAGAGVAVTNNLSIPRQSPPPHGSGKPAPLSASQSTLSIARPTPDLQVDFRGRIGAAEGRLPALLQKEEHAEQGLIWAKAIRGRVSWEDERSLEKSLAAASKAVRDCKNTIHQLRLEERTALPMEAANRDEAELVSELDKLPELDDAVKRLSRQARSAQSVEEHSQLAVERDSAIAALVATKSRIVVLQENLDASKHALHVKLNPEPPQVVTVHVANAESRELPDAKAVARRALLFNGRNGPLGLTDDQNRTLGHYKTQFVAYTTDLEWLQGNVPIKDGDTLAAPEFYRFDKAHLDQLKDQTNSLSDEALKPAFAEVTENLRAASDALASKRQTRNQINAQANAKLVDSICHGRPKSESELDSLLIELEAAEKEVRTAAVAENHLFQVHGIFHARHHNRFIAASSSSSTDKPSDG